MLSRCSKLFYSIHAGEDLSKLILNTYLMKILESFMQGKLDSVALCEDGFVTTEHFAAVIDGSTSKRATSMAAPLKVLHPHT